MENPEKTEYNEKIWMLLFFCDQLEAVLNSIWVFLFYGEKAGKFALFGAGIILEALVMNTVFRNVKKY